MADLFLTGQWFHYPRLPERDRDIYMRIYNTLRQRKTDVTFPISAHRGVYPSRDRVLEIFLHVIWDNPSLYFIDATNFFLGYTDKRRGLFQIQYTEYFDPDLSGKVEQVLRMRVDAILDQIPARASSYSKLYCLYRWLLLNVRYMEDINRQNTLKNLEARTIIGPLLNHLGVCAGYAKALKFLCDQLGIGCFYIRGTAQGAKGWGNHGWNVVYLEGKFYHLDVTFEDTCGATADSATWRYFLRSDHAMQKDHRWNTGYFPVMPDDYRNNDSLTRKNTPR